MTVNELIAVLSALPEHQRDWPIVAFTGSWDQSRAVVTGVYDYRDTWGDEGHDDGIEGDFIMVQS